MHNLKKSLLLALTVVLTLAACKKSTSPNSTSPDVYVSGYIQAANGPTVAVYWKNKVLIRLADSLSSSYAAAIAINGNDVYIAGTLTLPGGNTEIGYWKNGIFKSLGNAGLMGNASAIAISNDNVYVAGTSTGQYNQPVPTYWKNGVPHTLTDSSAVSIGRLYGLALNGNDVYVAGQVTSSDGNNIYPIYWKNDEAAYLLSNGGYAQGITIVNTEIYVAGVLTQGEQAIYWRDDSQTLLGGNLAIAANAITSSGNDVYIVGAVYIRSSNVTELTYWKNNNPIDIGSTLNGTALAISVSGNDVYTAGYYYPPYVYNPVLPNTYDGKAVYWKNNIPIKLTNAISAATGIIVVQR
jgi:hypothetical protein